MATAVLSNYNVSHEIMAPSLVSPNATRHGRGRHGGSMSKNNKGRGRGYSMFNEREAHISKALARILTRSEKPENSEVKLESDANGWFNCEDVLAHPHLTSLNTTFDELEALSIIPKTKFTLKLKSPDLQREESNASDYLIRSIPTAPVATSSAATPSPPSPVTSTSSDLPELIVYETSYANYPLIIASGGLKRAGGQAYLSFKPISLVQATELPPVTADVSIYIDLKYVLEAYPNFSWLRSDAGMILTEGDAEGRLPKTLWKKAVARRTDIGILFEDGEARKEVPAGLRGKGAKPKKGGKGRGKGAIEMRTREDEQTLSDQDEEAVCDQDDEAINDQEST